MTPTPFQICTTHSEGTAFVAIRGELDLATCPELEAVLAQQASADHRVVLDLSELRFIDSSGIRVLLMASRRAQREGSELGLIRGQEPVMRTLALCGATDELPFIGSDAAAL